METRPSLDQLVPIALEAMVQVGLDAREAHGQVLAGGLMNQTVRIQSTAGDHCVRLRSDTQGPSSQLFAAERLAAPLAHKAKIAMARLLGVARIASGPGWSAAVFETVTGERLDSLLSTAPDQVRSHLGFQLGRDLARLHALPCDRFGGLTEPGRLDAKAFLRELLEAETDPLARVDTALAHGYADHVRSTFDQLDLQARRPVFVHGDVHPRNLMVERDRFVWLDWEACRRRLPEFDFAQLPFMVWKQDSNLQNGFIRGYKSEQNTSILSANLIHILQIYWHIRFGLFLESCKFPFDVKYFGNFSYHLGRAHSLIAQSPADWALRLAHPGGEQ